MLVVACGDDLDAGPPESLGFTLVTPPALGVLSDKAPTWTHSLEAGNVGEDSFTVCADNRHGSASATVLNTITPVNSKTTPTWTAAP